jgi:hypothetical protein
MKQFYLLFFTVLSIANVNAQLTLSNHAPVVGEIHQRYQCDSAGLVPGAGGANSVWNYAIATRSSVIHSYTAGSSSYFPPATVSVTSNKSYEDHYKTSVFDLKVYSSSFPIVSGYYINLNYNAPALKTKYPMSLNVSSAVNTNGDINALMITPQAGTFTGTSSTMADGTGTLILPGQTYTNVIRVVNTEVISYVVSFPGTITIKSYEYYAQGAKQPVFSIQTVTLTRPAGTVKRTLVTRLILTAPQAPVDLTLESNKLSCENESATLTASGLGTIEWFDDISATVAIGSGSVFVTAPLPLGSYTYYAQATSFLPSARTAITFTVGDCTSLRKVSGDLDIKMYPNPTNALFMLELADDVKFLEFYSYDGELILKQDARYGVNTIDLSQQANGMYFVKLLNGNRIISIKKVLLLK